jgi:hypothetical protein
MSRPENAKGLVCPRCRSQAIEVLTNSPVKGVWTIYSCKTCICVAFNRAGGEHQPG